MHQKSKNQLYKEASSALNVFEKLATSNRETPQKFSGVSRTDSDSLEMAISKVAQSLKGDVLEKQAGFSNGLQMFSNLKSMISKKLGISEDVAHEFTSSVITKSDKIATEFGGDQMQIAEGIVNQMQGQVIENPSLVQGAFDLHPMSSNPNKIAEEIKMKLTSNLGMDGREAEVYKKVILKTAQDMTTMMRPHKREKIALAILDLMIEKRDKTVIYDVKDSPLYLQIIRDALEV